MLRHALATLAFTWIAVPGAYAATLVGDKFNVSFYYPTRTNLYLNEGDFTDPTSSIVIPRDPKGYGTLAANDIRYTFGQYDHFTTSPFDGVVFTDLTSSRITGVTFDKVTDASNLVSSDLAFTSDSISLNLSNVIVEAGTVIQLDIAVGNPVTHAAFEEARSLSLVPLPGTAPLLGAALVAFGAVGYALKRRAKAAA